ncbi:MAG TPA: methyl-accepting chemotaxis protein [Patescibacteria group bacterium]|nr:methyl-accepting chemotaxis protein [Patescibacteria group bacterium]
MNSIKTKFALLISLILVLSIGTTSFVSYYRTQASIKEQMQDDLMDLTKVTAREITGLVRTYQAESESMARDEVITSLDRVNGLARIERDVQLLKHYETIMVTDPAGNVLFGNNNASGSRADRDYFQQAVSTGKTVVSDPLISRTTNHLVYSITVPLKKAGTTVGYLITTASMDTVSQFIAGVKAGKTGYAFATDSKSLVFAHPNKDNILKLNFSQDTTLAQTLRDIGARMVKKESAVMNYQFQGQDKYMGFMPIANTPWIIAVSLTTAEFMEDLVATRNFTLGMAILMILLSVLLVYLFVARLVKPIEKMTLLAENLAAGDYTENTLSILNTDQSNLPQKTSGQDEISRLSAAFRTMADNTRGLLRKVHQNSQQLAASSQQLTASTEQSAQTSTLVATSITDVAEGASRQNQVVGEVSDVAQQTAASVEEVAATTTEVSEMADKMQLTSQKGRQAIDNVVRTMHSIKSESAQSAEQALSLATSADQIKEIVNVIQSIAGQTNLLALNAAIEAARAGEHGRGFAVVADEVRKLAEQSAGASEQIKQLIDAIHGKVTAVKREIDREGLVVEEGIGVANRAGESFEELSELLNLTVVQIKEVSTAIQHVAQGNQDVVSSIQIIDESSRNAMQEAQTVSAATEEQAASMQEIAAASRALAMMAEELNVEVTKFRL